VKRGPDWIAFDFSWLKKQGNRAGQAHILLRGRQACVAPVRTGCGR
jgi:hypothetical protein